MRADDQGSARGRREHTLNRCARFLPPEVDRPCVTESAIWYAISEIARHEAANTGPKLSIPPQSASLCTGDVPRGAEGRIDPAARVETHNGLGAQHEPAPVVCPQSGLEWPAEGCDRQRHGESRVGGRTWGETDREPLIAAIREACTENADFPGRKAPKDLPP